MSRDDQVTKITVEYKGCRRELEAKSAMVVVTHDDSSDDGVLSGISRTSPTARWR